MTVEGKHTIIPAMQNYPYVVTISSEKGGVGKTTLATNLAIFLKALSEELSVSLLSLDNHFTVDKMFAFPGQNPRGDVLDLFLETSGSAILQTGQYGVNYIPSSTALPDIKHSIKDPMTLARLLSASQIPGILIIDTSPDLDILTQNALYAADRAIIPVKDTPSLENCRNIFALFDKRGLDKKALSLIPCLIDSRIKYDGPFRDQKALLKAYAINRGYRCFDTHISKSPKVESLNTNPSGKIYPILTHARGTDVYGQFLLLARTILQEYHAAGHPRAFHFHQWQKAEVSRKNEAFSARLSAVKPHCLLCGRSLTPGAKEQAAFYYEASDGSNCGFVEQECFTTLLFSAIYNQDGNLADDDPVRLILQDTARDSAFVFRPVQNGGDMVEFQRFDLHGKLLATKLYPFREYDGGLLGREANSLFQLVARALPVDKGNPQDTLFLLVHPVNQPDPQDILREEPYRRFSKLRESIRERLAVT